MKEQYTEAGFRWLHFPMPHDLFDNWGWETGFKSLGERVQVVLQEYQGKLAFHNDSVIRKLVLAEIVRQPKQWQHSFSVMDDFGTATPSDPFAYGLRDQEPVLAPDYANPPAEGEPYKYILYYPNGH